MSVTSMPGSKNPLSKRALNDARQTELVRQAWTDSGKVYGYRKLTDDLRDQGEQISENRVARMASLAGVSAQIGYRGPLVDTEPSHLGSPQMLWIGNSMSTCLTGSGTRPFSPSVREQWLSDFTYIKTHEGWLYLSVVIDLFSLRVDGSRMTTELALQALLMAVWRRKPKAKLMIHSDQGSQSTSREWQAFLSQHNLEASMSRRGTVTNVTLSAIGPRTVVAYRSRELLLALEAGADKATHLSNTQRRKAGCLRMHRDVLQPETQTHEQRHAVAR